ncbi:MAG: hypothetical protein DWI58_07000 [Chloroflexi bacterium]|nr:MAG: hypothetical protein DWI58_07000 [Chloroflexota bacterium]
MIALRRGAFVTLLLLALVPSTAHAQTAALTLDALRNATYPVEAVPGKVAALKDGHFEVAAAPGSSSKATETSSPPPWEPSMADRPQPWCWRRAAGAAGSSSGCTRWMPPGR